MSQVFLINKRKPTQQQRKNYNIFFFIKQAVTAVVDDKQEMVLPFVHKNEPFA